MHTGSPLLAKTPAGKEGGQRACLLARRAVNCVVVQPQAEDRRRTARPSGRQDHLEDATGRPRSLPCGKAGWPLDDD